MTEVTPGAPWGARPLGAILALVVLFALAGVLGLGAAPALAFTDVPGYHAYAAAISELSADGVIDGYPDGSFGPSDPVMRQQFAKMIALALKLQVSEEDTCTFPDVDVGGPDTLYPDNYVAVAAKHGITKGTIDHGTLVFRPWASITRGQVLLMVVRAADSMMPGLLTEAPYGFGTLGAYAAESAGAVARAEYGQLLVGLVGFGSGWDPWAPASRGEVAQVLWRVRRLAFREGKIFSPQELYDDYAGNRQFDGVYTRAELEALLTDPVLRTSGEPRALRLARSLLQDHPRIGRIMYDGDSMTAGSNATFPYPSQLMAAWPRAVPWANIAIGGQPLFRMLAKAPQDVDTFYVPGVGQNVVVIWGGTNDVALWNHTVDEIYGQLERYADDRRAAGFRVVVLTMLPRSDPPAPPDFEARRQSFNRKLRVNWQRFADLMVNVAGDPRIGGPGGERNLLYYTSDRVHLNNTGLGVVSSLVRSQLLKLDRWTGLPQ